MGGVTEENKVASVEDKQKEHVELPDQRRSSERAEDAIQERLQKWLDVVDR